jgi:outer membrane protein OmpA-like peptidoglycan-associated protein
MGHVVKSAQAWIMGIVALAGVGALTLPPKVAALQTDLQSRANALLAEPQYAGVVALADGQALTVYLTEDYHGKDEAQKLQAAAKAVSDLKGVEGLTQHGGWLYGPVTSVSISHDRLTLAELEAAKGVLLAKPAGQVSASSASVDASLVEDLAAKCDGSLDVALKGRTLDFSDNHNLTPDSGAVLDDLVAALRNCPSNIKLNVVGVTQAGEAAGKQGPAFSRAQAVADALVLRGYDPYRLNVQAQPAPDDAKADGPKDGQLITFAAVAR